MSYLFVIVGTKDNPLFQAEFGTRKAGGDGAELFFCAVSGRNAASKSVCRARNTGCSGRNAVGASDNVRIQYVRAKGMQMRVYERLMRGEKFMLLHEIRNEDGIRHFFQEVYDLYTKCLMNPFYEADMPITSFVFEQKVKQIAKRHL
ncbi:hypothetical protein PORY_000659 [Pneumocystis oryctolagi]|uniref:Uncharacterized protein n=1 Tax=Pneumocystis oryctolagi TaxID=42067 RepID=A0ACB7CIR2_9ASCO|nr:hypothetical protein PORY_000659 [Pneumocystis oryctolagi]